MDTTTNSLNWFEIPVLDMARAKHFYQVIFSAHLEEIVMGDYQMAMFPMEMGSGKVAGALVRSEMHRPSQDGVLIYLNGDPDLQSVLDKIESEGGKILMPKTLIDEQTGYMAFFLDTEGNKMGVHSQR